MAVPSRGSIVIDGVTYLRNEGPNAPVRRVDRLPHTSRAPIGEARYDVYDDGAFYAQAQWGGGIGQERLLAGDQVLTGIFDGRSGKAFPARKSLGTAATAINGRLFTMGDELYCLTTSGTIRGVSAGATDSDTGGFFPKDQNPCVTSNNCRLYVGTNGEVYRWFETGADSDIQQVTPPNMTDVDCVAAYGRFVYAFGYMTISSSISTAQSNTDSATDPSNTFYADFDNRPKSKSVLVGVIQGIRSSNDDPSWVVPEGWRLERTTSVAAAGSGEYLMTSIFTCARPSEARTHGPFRCTGDFTDWSCSWHEVEGVRQDKVVQKILTTTGTALTGISSGTFTGLQSSFILAGHLMDSTVTGYTEPSAFTDRIDTTVGDAYHWIGYDESSGASTTPEDATIGGTPAGIGWGIVLEPRDASGAPGFSYRRWDLAGSATYKQMVVAYTEDEGDDWHYIYTAVGSGISEVLNAMAAGGTLYLVTKNGLYEMEEQELITLDASAEETVDVVFRGPVSSFSKPASSYGNWMAEYEQVIYYNLGTTIRRYAPRGEDTEVWPLRDWALPVGNIDCLVSGEGGIWFSTEGHLFLYNGRGTHCLAKEATSNDFKSLALYEGRMYHRRALYLNFAYPTSRPDHYLSASDCTTGKIITSALDFEKTNLWKLLTVFELQYRFTSSTNAGQIDLYYFSSCATGVGDPGSEFDGSGVTWTKIGSVTSTSAGFSEFTRGSWDLDPVKRVRCRRMYLRIDLIPGTSGYPILEAVVAHGVTANPEKKQIQVPLIGQVGLPDKNGDVFYDTDSDVVSMVQALLALRGSQDLLTLEYDDGSGSSVSYDVVTSLHDDALIEEIDGDGEGMTTLVNLAFDEVP